MGSRGGTLGNAKGARKCSRPDGVGDHLPGRGSLIALSVNPRADFTAAPFTIKLTYQALGLVGILWLAGQAVATYEGGGSAVPLFLANLLLGYLIFDSGLVILKGKPMGLGLGRFWSLLAIAVAGLTVTGFNAQSPLVTLLTGLSGVAGLITMGLLGSRAAKRHFYPEKGNPFSKGRQKDSDAGRDGKRPGDGPKSGSFEDLMAKEKR